jgi:hypothetical protein
MASLCWCSPVTPPRFQSTGATEWAPAASGPPAGPTLLGPFDTTAASLFDHTSLYAGHLVRDRGGRWNLLGFRYDEDDAFVGKIADPIAVQLAGRRLTAVPSR